MFGTMSQFERAARAIANSTGWRLSNVEDDTAILYIPGHSDYPICFSLSENGMAVFTCRSQAYWEGREPTLAHQLMEELDRQSDAIMFRVERGDSGKARCYALTKGRLGDLTPSIISRTVGEMMGSMSGADRLFRKRGVA